MRPQARSAHCVKIFNRPRTMSPANTSPKRISKPTTLARSTVMGAVGFGVGTGEGGKVGTWDGVSVGTCEGVDVGTIEGTREGGREGTCDG